MSAHVHVLPIHEGWTVEETVGWLEQGLLLPDAEPAGWTAVEVPVSWLDCRLCRNLLPPV